MLVDTLLVDTLEPIFSALVAKVPSFLVLVLAGQVIFLFTFAKPVAKTSQENAEAILILRLLVSFSSLFGITVMVAMEVLTFWGHLHGHIPGF
jgi:hypothetical protein